MFNFLWNKLFGLKCPTPGCRNRLKQIKESPRPMADQFYCKRCDITYTGSQLKLFRVSGYNKIDPTGRRRQEAFQFPFDCPICYETFSMPLRKSGDTTASRFLCPICKHYFPNPKYVKPEPQTPVFPVAPLTGQIAITDIPGVGQNWGPVSNPAAEFVPVPVLNKCDTCSQEFGDCAGGITFDGLTDAVIECTGYTKKENNGQ